MDFNIWIEKNELHINNIIDNILNFLNLYKNKFNFEINQDITNKIASYVYDTSSNRNENI
tara:strand:- start:863 stop:1042 length:180 start_codon:yes stop_codon:yes gene_type:complete